MDTDPNLVKHIVEVGAGAWASKDIVAKILGPTAEYLGGEIRNFAAKCNINLSQVFEKARKKLGGRIDEPGQVNPRVLKGVLQDGAFADDEVAAEYFGGILAAARSEDGRDDRGVAFLALIRDLSAYQLHFHYLCYSWMRSLYGESGLQIGLPTDRRKIRIFISMDLFKSLIQVSTAAEKISLVDHCVLGLARLGLISDAYVYGSQDQVQTAWSKAPSAGIIVSPTPYGAELFLWAHGLGNKSVNELLSPELDLAETDTAEIPKGVCAIHEEKEIARLRGEIDKLSQEIKAYRDRVDVARREEKYPPALPLDLKQHAEYVIEEVRNSLNVGAAIVMQNGLDTFLYPDENASLDDRLDSLASVTSTAYNVLKDEEERTAG